MTLYGFNKSDADQLVKVARREGQRPRNKASVKYPEPLPSTGVEIHRGVTNAQINKGSTSGTVSRYTDGTDTDSGTDDTVTNDLADIGSGKKVIYVKLGSIYYILNSEKTSLTVLEDMRIKSGDTQIEAQGQTVFVDTTATAAWSDKIPLTSCP